MLVKDVKFKDNKVEIVTSNGSFFISKENYIENPIANDSSIDQKRIDYLLEYERVILAKTNIIKTLNKKILSEYSVRKKLKDDGLNNKEISEIINSLLRMGLLNDEYYASVKLDSLLMKRKGKLEIRKELSEEKININFINKCIDSIEDEIYLNNFNKVKEKYLKMYSNKASKVKEQMVKLKLKEYGYEEELINCVNVSKDNNSEVELARVQLAKLLKNKQYSLNDSMIVNKIRAKLMAKGFSYDIINVVLEEVKEHETY